MSTHELKIDPAYFNAVKEGGKTFEYRVNDRGFQHGDRVVLREYDILGIVESERYTGRTLHFRVGYVLSISATHVVFSLLGDTNEW